ncbi:Neuropeptide receptor A32 [Operophtera brumata]|uniref:Neuropeptide receptor A32 n=1 Tax=Operophtera brumata TaxID=104452 RepID=A0A0L7L4Q7_OPEBR|nr:Neuropeptide receptor A32 [Operophtera brumata]
MAAAIVQGNVAKQQQLFSSQKQTTAHCLYVVKMFILVIVIFGICWLPYHTYFIYTHFHPSILYMKYVQHMYLGFYWLAMANAMVNPLIYYWMNAK